MKPNVRHLRTFGCQVWFLDMNSRKLDRRGRQGILLRCLAHNAYRIWDVQKRKVLRVRHLSFEETVFPRDGLGRWRQGQRSNQLD